MILSPATWRVTRNLASSYAYVGMQAAVTVFAIPLYVRMLGPAQWGNVALCVTLQGLLFALDFALGPLLMREAARAGTTGGLHAVYQRFLRYYGVTALVACGVGLLVLFSVERSRALHGDPLPQDLTAAMCLALVQFLFQFSNNAATGYWNGLERQQQANVRMAAFALGKHAAALLLLSQWTASATIYMIPFAAIGAIEFALNHRLVTRERVDPETAAPAAAGAADSRDLAGYVAGAAVGIATAQIDRIFLAFALPTEQFGIYVAISNPILSLLSVQMPIQRAFLPRIVVAASPVRVARSMLAVTTALIVLPCLAMSAFPEFILRIWLRDPAIAAAGAVPFSLLLIAVALIALYSPCSMLLLHYHRNRTIGVIGAAILCVQLLALALLTPTLGITAGAIAWLACGLIQAVSAVVLWRSVGRR